jgi:hypothetical protein
MPSYINLTKLRNNKVDAAEIGDTIKIDGVTHRICITDDGRKYAHRLHQEAA